MNVRRFLLVVCLGISLLAACTTAPASEPSATATVGATPVEATEALPTPTEAPPEEVQPALPFKLISTAFDQGEPIPAIYSCDGKDISPSLAWGDPPEGTQSLALIMEDPDAPGGTFDHWILFNISPLARELPEGMAAGQTLDGVAPTFGSNSWGRADYGGPCPPGSTHRYYFRLYALDTTLSLNEGADKKEVLAAMDGHILAQAELMGTYTR
jgi:Raf kinase inhibitor-like YbhB/YbcL family protein